MDPLTALLEVLESLARQHCHTRRVDRDYNGQVVGSLVTDSGALSANAEALELLAEHKRFHVIRAGGRMVVGYWPEDLPEIYRPPAATPQSPANLGTLPHA